MALARDHTANMQWGQDSETRQSPQAYLLAVRGTTELPAHNNYRLMFSVRHDKHSVGGL